MGHCDHDYRPDGVVYELGDLVGHTTAHELRYYSAYYCRRCLHRQFFRLDTGDKSEDDGIEFGALPFRSLEAD